MRELPSRESPWIKVCGLKTEADIAACIDAGATHIGLNLFAPSPRSIDLHTAAALRRFAQDKISVVVLGVEPDQAVLNEWATIIAPDWFQLHGDLSGLNLADLDTPWFRARGLRDTQDLRLMEALTDPFLLIDAKDEKVHGGTGRLAPTELARELCASRACVLAGGLDPSNVTQQVERVRPFGVDVASGVEEVKGEKSRMLISAFCKASRKALEAIAS